MPKVFEGSAELNIQPFIDALAKMEGEAGKSATNIAGIFQTLDQNIANALANFQGHLNGVAQQISSIGAALAGANAQMKQGQQQLNQQAQQSQQQAQANAQQANQLRQAQLQQVKANFEAELQLRRQFNAEDERSARERLMQDRNTLRQAGEADAQQILQNYQRQKQIVQRQLDEMRKMQQEALRAQATAAGQKADLAGLGPKPADLEQRIAAIEAEYQRAGNAAKMYAQEASSAERQLSTVMQGEAEARNAVMAKFTKEQQARDDQARRDFKDGWKGAWDQAITDFQRTVKQVEDKWNSVFRAGSQLQSIGVQLTALSAGLTATGLKLTENAGDFDFWSRRTVAAAKAANESLYDAFGGDQQATMDAFNNKILEVGRGLGTLKPEEVAQSWYLYQAAVGQAIETTGDLQASQEAVDVILKAAVISDTNYETAIRGVTQAMAEFGMGQEQAAHATQVMLNLTQTSQSEFSDVLESFKMVGPQAHALGVSLEETSAIVARLSDYGLRGSRAGTALQQVLTTMLDPADKGNEALQHLLITSQGLTGDWRNLVFQGGQFIGFLDTLDQQGQVTQKGLLHLFADATKAMNEPQREAYLAQIFSQNAFRNLIPLVREYVQGMQSGAAETATGKKRLEELEAEFANAQLQASLFGDQWQLVSESIKVRLGQATYGIKESLVRLGYLVAETFLPIVERLNVVIQKFLEWGQTHPQLAKGIIQIAASIAVLTAIAGPALIILGQILQAVSAIATAKATLGAALKIVQAGFGGLGAAIGAIAGPILIVIAIIGALYLAWKNNFLGMGQSLGQFFGALQSEFSALGDFLEGVFSLITGILTGNTEQIQAALRNLTVAFIEAFMVLPQQLVDGLSGAANTLLSWAADTFGSLGESMVVWGYNLMMSLVNGIYEGAEAVWAAAESVAEGIAMYFRSFSPPRHGPLQGIFVWGRNLIGTLIEGMNAADISAVEDITSKIGDVLKFAIDQGDVSADVYAETMTAANGLMASMIDQIKEGGEVTAEFFEPLRAGLGQWYDEVVDIALAYQEVYQAQAALDIEKEKLDLLKQQRKELDAQAEARNKAFDKALGIDDPNSSYSEFAQAEMVDPTSEEGKAKIEQMRRTLSKEDFQTWIAWQRKLWDQQHDVQADALKTQEDAQQVAVDALQKQVDLAKEQYDYFVKMFEYAQRLLQLQEEEDRLKEKQKTDASKGIYGSPEDLSAAKAEIAGVVGADAAILDEGTLKQKRNGDDIGALTDASKQKEKEEERLSELEKLNRRKRAEFETALINATSDEERQRIKEQKDAWDAAYKEEKARLQERLSFTKEIEEAAKKAADATFDERVAGQAQQYQQEINAILGDQNGQILDANALKAKAGDLDQAAILATSQLRDEERELRDLQALNDQKKLEFEERLRAAKDDPEATRRIKDEQEAWEAAYKRALEVQQARVEAARRAKQDIADQDTADGPDGRAKKGFEPPAIPGGGAGIGGPLTPPAWATKPPEWVTNPPVPKLPEAPRQSKLEAEGIFDNLKRGIDFLNDKTVDSRTKLRFLGEAVKEAFGWKTWWDALAPEDTRNRIQRGWQRVISGITDTWDGIKKTWTQFWTDLDTKWTNFKNGVSTAWGNFWDGVSQKWTAFTDGFKKGWDQYWDKFFAPVYAAVGLFYVLWLTFKEWWTGFWNGITTWWTQNVSTPFTQWWNSFWSGILSWWQTNVSTPFTTGWNTFWSGILTWWQQNVSAPFTQWWNGFWSGILSWWETNVKTPFTTAWNQFWSDANKVWTAFKTEVERLWGEFWTNLSREWNTFKTDVERLWGEFWGNLKTAWTTFKGEVETLWGQFWSGLKTAWTDFYTPVKEGWDGLVSKISTVFSNITSFFSSLETTINRLIRIGKSLLSLGGGGGDNKPEGSYAVGLPYVPKDGFIAELHKGERVLTAAEAALYNSVEQFGLLGVLNALAGGATAKVAQATAPQSVVHQYNIKEGDQKTVNFGDVNIDATNPDEGRAFLHKLAFLA